MGNIQTAGPNEALIVSGGCCRPSRKQIIVGGWCWSTWMLTNSQRLSLQVMTLTPRCERVQSTQGVPVTVTAVVHCKIMSNPEFLPLAAEQFLGKSIENIKSVILHTVEGHMRAVIGTQTIEDICKKRQTLASLIREATSKDVSRMGIDIMSLTVKEIKDDVEYLESSGKKAKAIVKRDAAISCAQAESQAAQVISGCKKEIEERRLESQTKIAQMEHEMSIAQATYRENLEKIQAEADKAYDHLCATLNKDLKTKEMETKSVEYDQLIEIKKKENELRKTELEISTELTTKSEIYELNKRLDATRERCKLEVEAEEYKIRVEGEARAEAAKIEGLAEARGLKLVAEARKEYNEAGVLFDVLKALPELAAEVAQPLKQFEEIVLISEGSNLNKTLANSSLNSSSITGAKSVVAEAAKITSSIPLALQAVGKSEKQSNNILNSIFKLQMSVGSLKQST